MSKIWRLLIEAKRAINRISGVCEQFAIASVIGLTCFIGYEVIVRNVFSNPTGFADEVGGYLFVVIIFFSAAGGVRDDRHVRVTLFYSKLSTKWQRSLDLLMFLIGIGGWGFVCYYSCRVVERSYQDHIASIGGLEVPLWIPQLIIPIGLFVFLLQLLVQLFEVLSSIRREDDCNKNS